MEQGWERKGDWWHHPEKRGDYKINPMVLKEWLNFQWHIRDVYNFQWHTRNLLHNYWRNSPRMMRWFLRPASTCTGRPPSRNIWLSPRRSTHHPPVLARAVPIRPLSQRKVPRGIQWSNPKLACGTPFRCSAQAMRSLNLFVRLRPSYKPWEKRSRSKTSCSMPSQWCLIRLSYRPSVIRILTPRTKFV